jgi:hypothetical protein
LCVILCWDSRATSPARPIEPLLDLVYVFTLIHLSYACSQQSPRGAAEAAALFGAGDEVKAPARRLQNS